MKRYLGFLMSLAVALMLLAIPASQSVWSKAHVPIDRLQVCHSGLTRVVKDKDLRNHLGHGDCRLPACDFNNVFLAGSACPGDADGDGLCDLPSFRAPADGITPACTPAF